MEKLLHFTLLALLLIPFNIPELKANEKFTYPEAELTVNVQATNVTCSGKADGKADITVNGGVAPYSFLWSNGAITEDVENLSPGAYTVTVKDASGVSAKACITITSPLPLSLKVTGTTEICSGPNGTVTASAKGGTAPYSYLWSNGATTPTVNGLTAGNYSVEITDFNGCTTTSSFQINATSSFTVNVTSNNPTCNDASNGSLMATPSGGLAPYTYLWSTGATTAMVSMLAAGSYSVQVTDAKGCSANATAILTPPVEMTATIVSSVDVCTGGIIDLTVSGGTEPYRYIWSNQKGTQDQSNLDNGTYDVTVTDAKGCRAFASVEFTDLNLIKVASQVNRITCNGSGFDGVVNLSVLGGTAPYTYLWNTGATTEDLSGLAAGSYTVTVTDANGCQKNHTAIIQTPESFDYEIKQTDISCNGATDGSVIIDITNGTPPYRYNWSTGDTTSGLSNLGPGNYEVEITDGNGCSQVISVTMIDPPLLFLTLEGTDLGCDGGSLNLSVGGGTSPYQYTWSNGATTEDLTGLNPGEYSVVVKDAHGCADSTSMFIEGNPVTKITVTSTPLTCAGSDNATAKVSIEGETGPYIIQWSNGESTEEITGLKSGAYTVRVTDNYNCIKTGSVTIKEPALIGGTLIKKEVSCSGQNDGFLRAFVSGGVSPYSYKWSNGQTTSLITGLSSGSYTVDVTDASGCILTLTETLTEPVGMTTTLNTSPSCLGGNIDLTVTGGTEPYQYSWSNGAISEDLIKVPAGKYIITITDKNNCKTSDSTTLVEPSGFSATIQANGGSADLTVNGGVAPYTFLWSNGATTEDVSSLADGEYSVEITDALGCTATAFVTIKNISGIVTATIDCCQDMEICNGDTARIPVNFTGSAPYTFTYKEGTVLKTVNTNENPYYITVAPSSTLTLNLVSVGNECNSGTVCGKATIGVNDCQSTCNDCFKTYVESVTEEGSCRTVVLKVTNDGNCLHGLSHYSVSIPCGKITQVCPSRKYPVEIGADPTTKINGFKIDDISWFGEEKDGKPESFTIKYVICDDGKDCFNEEFCSPLVSYKAGKCISYEKVEYQSLAASTDDVNSSEEVMINVYPNPSDRDRIINVKLSKHAFGDTHISIVNQMGREVASEKVVAYGGEIITMKLGQELPPGLYFVISTSGGNTFKEKLLVR